MEISDLRQTILDLMKTVDDLNKKIDNIKKERIYVDISSEHGHLRGIYNNIDEVQMMIKDWNFAVWFGYSPSPKLYLHHETKNIVYKSDNSEISIGKFEYVYPN